MIHGETPMILGCATYSVHALRGWVSSGRVSATLFSFLDAGLGAHLLHERRRRGLAHLFLYRSRYRRDVAWLAGAFALPPTAVVVAAGTAGARATTALVVTAPLHHVDHAVLGMLSAELSDFAACHAERWMLRTCWVAALPCTHNTDHSRLSMLSTKLSLLAPCHTE